MLNENLVKYINRETSRGIVKEAIADALLKAGWSLEGIENGFLAVNPLPPPPEEPQTASEEDICSGCGTSSPERCDSGHCLKCAGQCSVCDICLECRTGTNFGMCVNCADD